MNKNTTTGLYEVRVDGRLYEFEKWGAEESLDVLLELAPIIGGPIGAALGGVMAKDGLDTDINAGMLGTILEHLMKNIKKDVVKPIIMKLCSGRVWCDGKPVKFNEHYKENIFNVIKVVKAGLEVQYGNFSAGDLGLGAGQPLGVINRA